MATKRKTTKKPARRLTVAGLKLDIAEFENDLELERDNARRLEHRVETLTENVRDCAEALESMWRQVLALDEAAHGPHSESRKRSDARGLSAVLRDAHAVQEVHKTVRYLTPEELAAEDAEAGL